MMRALIGGLVLAILTVAPVWAQTTNQLFMTGTGTGNTPVIYSNGVDTNINIGLIPKGSGGVAIGTASPIAGYLLTVSGGINTSSASGSNPALGGAQTSTSSAGVAGSITGASNTGSGILGQNTGTTNTGYAGLFSNTGTGAVNYGVFATTASGTGYAGYFQGTVNVTGTVFANLLTLTSDRRMKRNIHSLDPEDALEHVDHLRPVAFAWKDSGKPDMGLVGQEIAKVYPDLVLKGNDGKVSVEYVSLIAPLIASVQALRQRESELEAKTQDLQRELDEYRASHP